MKFCEIPAARGVDIGNSLNRLRTLENPIIKRNFTKSFHLGQFEVTQAQYIAIMGEEPWINERGNYRYGAREGENFPANYISHRKALEFTRILSLLDKKATYRLPTEAEWEYAARAGSKGHYYWGKDYDTDYVVAGRGGGSYPNNVNECPSSERDLNSQGYCANDFGLMHMIGNMAEHTLDDYSNSYRNASVNGHLPMRTDHGAKMVRGGAWNWHANSAYAANRDHIYPDNIDKGVGFRVLRIVNESKINNWNVEQTINQSGTLISNARIDSMSSDTFLSLECIAPHADIQFKIGLEDSLWRALGYSLKVANQELKIKLMIDNSEEKEFELNYLSHESDGTILSNNSDEEVILNYLKAGRNVRVMIDVFGGNLEEFTILNEELTLRGSRKAIFEAQSRCVGQ